MLFGWGVLVCFIETGSHYVTLAYLVLTKYGQADLKLTVIPLPRPLECGYLKHAPQSVFCSVSCHKLQREWAQEGLLEEAVLEGGEDNSQGKECSSQPDRDKTLLGRNLVLCSGIYEE